MNNDCTQGKYEEIKVSPTLCSLKNLIRVVLFLNFYSTIKQKTSTLGTGTSLDIAVNQLCGKW